MAFEAEQLGRATKLESKFSSKFSSFLAIFLKNFYYNATVYYVGLYIEDVFPCTYDYAIFSE